MLRGLGRRQPIVLSSVQGRYNLPTRSVQNFTCAPPISHRHQLMEPRTLTVDREQSPSSCLEMDSHPPQQHIAHRAIHGFLNTARIVGRLVYLGWIFSVPLLTAPFLWCSGSFHERWWRWLRVSILRAGPCWVKLSQWACTRPDLFPASVVHRLKSLQSSTHTPPQELVRAELLAAFGAAGAEQFQLQQCVGSGAVASVHR